ncbi:hypothetical protein ACI2JA_15965 [Alkalihalobacillus sp. NPDC078783]
MKSFFKIGLIVSLMTCLFVASLYVGRFIDMKALANEYQMGTMISGVEVGGLSPDEAQVELMKQMDERRNNQTIELYLYDSNVLLPGDALQLRMPELNVDIPERVEQDATIDVTLLTEAIGQIESAELQGLVDIPRLKEDIERQVNEQQTIPVSIHLAPYIDELMDEQSVLANVYKPYLESTLLQQWAQALDGYVLEPRQTFSLKDALAEMNQVVVGGESLDLFASAMYQVMAKSNLDLIEHHSPSKLPYATDIGFSASVNEEHRNLIFFNPNYATLELHTTFSNDGLIVELIGTPYLHEYELVVEDQETIQPRLEIQYSKKRRAGNSQLIENGKQGSAATLYRKEVGANQVEIDMLLLARDYVAAKPDIEERSVYALLEPEPEPLIDQDLQPVIIDLPEGQSTPNVIENPQEHSPEPTNSMQTQPLPTEQPEDDKDPVKGETEPTDEEQKDES